ncbi:MAG: type II toxin-antitoxin system RelE/ParE family toxin [Nitrososphaerota archaeon]|nr:type II toxin-antitoxin system RelE/ParE family toxin [Nitrososphaerota archaeon]MDG6910870.1 type II toxin-antitoxin system RelE/ParE family toxin [Nitrososphaerota archaeon]MDG6912139.1 type II toxin-antitoxin system RelE/ParE family toxin [Nitrososphaerota archaeon]MDG6924612.1 type II toxin-antitoxin system RelE/ParE family toxin [Nitrososphaerota archaeon]MDG6941175.1 type II toxin-antitoxin system RelE/ParE family toxin [Nitrososphaerota archaeon]
MASKILYKASVRHDLKKIDKGNQERIFHQIRESLAGSPTGGEPLHGEFAGLFKLRVGDYRVIYALVGEDVLVLRIRHRSRAYG